MADQSVLVTLKCCHFALLPPRQYEQFQDAFAENDNRRCETLLLLYSHPQGMPDALCRRPPTASDSMPHVSCGRIACKAEPQACPTRASTSAAILRPSPGASHQLVRGLFEKPLSQDFIALSLHAMHAAYWRDASWLCQNCLRTFVFSSVVIARTGSNTQSEFS